jgi:hypothetical protein
MGLFFESLTILPDSLAMSSPSHDDMKRQISLIGGCLYWSTKEAPQTNSSAGLKSTAVRCAVPADAKVFVSPFNTEAQIVLSRAPDEPSVLAEITIHGLTITADAIILRDLVHIVNCLHAGAAPPDDPAAIARPACGPAGHARVWWAWAVACVRERCARRRAALRQSLGAVAAYARLYPRLLGSRAGAAAPLDEEEGGRLRAAEAALPPAAIAAVRDRVEERLREQVHPRSGGTGGGGGGGGDSVGRAWKAVLGQWLGWLVDLWEEDRGGLWPGTAVAVSSAQARALLGLLGYTGSAGPGPAGLDTAGGGGSGGGGGGGGGGLLDATRCRVSVRAAAVALKVVVA